MDWDGILYMQGCGGLFGYRSFGKFIALLAESRGPRIF
jgi:hypothetical protein